MAKNKGPRKAADRNHDRGIVVVPMKRLVSYPPADAKRAKWMWSRPAFWEGRAEQPGPKPPGPVDGCCPSCKWAWPECSCGLNPNAVREGGRVN